MTTRPTSLLRPAWATIGGRFRPALPFREDRARHLLAVLHDRDRRPPEAREVHERLLLRALDPKPGR